MPAFATTIAPTASDVADLAAVLSAWQTLSTPIKAGIVAMVKASVSTDGKDK